MKKCFALLLAVLLGLACFVCVLAEEEQGISFDTAELSLFVKKTAKLKLDAHGLKGKAVYASSDESIAAVNQSGSVKGVSEGEAVITCTFTAKDEQVYTAECRVTVSVPVAKINIGKKIAMAPDTWWVIQDVVISPEDATNQKLVWSSSKESVATVDQNGVVYAHEKGTAKITAAAEDGSKVKASVTVTVKKYDLVITEKSGGTVSYTTGDGGIFGINDYTKTGCVTTYGSGGNEITCHPVKAGEDTVSISVSNYFTRRTRWFKYSVYVAQSAVGVELPEGSAVPAPAEAEE